MTKFSYCLAKDANREWRLVFVPDDLHLYVALYRNGRIARRRGYMTIEDFLITLPKDDLREQAHQRLVALLSRLIQEADNLVTLW